jgi:hypothetical protein
MAFTLFTDADGGHVEFGDKASYNFNTAGLLVVVADDGMRLTYSPQAWHRIEDQPNASVW